MKRVGTLTFSNTVNFGASLQACALCKMIESLGCECEILNYSNKELDDRELGTSFSLKPPVRFDTFFAGGLRAGGSRLSHVLRKPT